jgi:hypothetical protein
VQTFTRSWCGGFQIVVGVVVGVGEGAQLPVTGTTAPASVVSGGRSVGVADGKLGTVAEGVGTVPTGVGGTCIGGASAGAEQAMTREPSVPTAKATELAEMKVARVMTTRVLQSTVHLPEAR